MKRYAFMFLMLVSVAFANPGPQEEGLKPGTFCAPNHRDAELRCMCVKQDPERCSNGKSTRERPPDGTQVCKLDCHMENCACCLS